MNGDCLPPVFFRVIFSDQRDYRSEVYAKSKTHYKSRKIQQQEIVSKGD